MNLALSLLNPTPPGSPCTLEGVPTFHLVHWCLETRALLPRWPHLWALSALHLVSPQTSVGGAPTVCWAL